MTRLKERIAVLEHDVAAARAVAEQQQELRLVIGRLEDFATTVRDNLDQVAWDTKRTLIRTLVKRVEVGLDEIRVIFRIGPDPSGPESSCAVLPDHSRRLQAKNRGLSQRKGLGKPLLYIHFNIHSPVHRRRAV